MTPEDTIIHCPEGMTRDEIRAAGHAMLKVKDRAKNKFGYVAGMASVGAATIVRLVEKPNVGPGWEASPTDLKLAEVVQ